MIDSCQSYFTSISAKDNEVILPDFETIFNLFKLFNN